ncbi:hypothetical protein [Thioclava sp. F36-6]|uniref:hypothetical protein n=1 Tax=Thioclava sp. F36-6 TaxID=1915316 RepID=UPI000998A52F|nr:hypothetical protein [Thioclava sp. F36-6]OOY31607.1 hypothetical protein BMI88_11040 [Thioclava sp. F36-6]
MTNSYDHLRDQFIRDETAKAERQDAEFFSAQENLNRNAIRADRMRQAMRPGLAFAALAALLIGAALIFSFA